MKFTKHQLALLARLFNGVQPSTATIQNTARSLIRAGLVHRYKSGGRVWLTALPTGLRAYSDHLNASRGKTRQSPATAQTAANPSPDILGDSKGLAPRARAPERGRQVRWSVPFCYQGREIDAVVVTAKTRGEARKLAVPIWTDRGYSTHADYSIGRPYTDEAL